MAITLQAARRALAFALDDLGVYIASAGSSTSFTIIQASNATANASTDRLDGAWAYIATGGTAGQQRRVRPAGLTPSTGVVQIYHDWTAPVPGAEIEITHLFPSMNISGATTGEDVDYGTLLNRALARYEIAGQIFLSTVAGQRTYSLATYAAWLDRDRLLAVYDPPYVSGDVPVRADWRGLRLDLGASGPVLRVDAPWAATSEAVTIDVARPANSLISGAESTVGLVAETDTIPGDVRLDELIDVAKHEAFMALAIRGHSGRDWAAAAKDQEPIALDILVRARRRARGQPEQAPPSSARAA